MNGPAFNYHLLRSALSLFSKNLAELDRAEYRQVRDQALKSFELETRVLATDEARDLVIPEKLLDASLQRLSSRYADRDEFLQDLKINSLDEAGLRVALHRELLFDAVLQRVAADCPPVSDVDIGLFYEMHRDRFETPELRVARHILITVNPDFPDNTRTAAKARMEQVVEKLAGRVNRFADFAKRFSECPTAMEGGALGDVKPGQLYAELDALLFSMQAGEISPIVESEMGFHILLCERIKPGKRMSLTKATPRIRSLLQERQQRNRQKAWLETLPQRTELLLTDCG
ncbi:nitrogen fixation protein NifM [Sedimenticola thiotaurini]|uniref:peptidylprolyl isomerase n=1 Tax=Sedimenticola thiotaurini TaxID=1543721 RepID=A0A0F7K1G4_9GAMM|nr:nitrogen fixation protein NifM [Sedimenticola thiotaurini]AKH21722.1 hypothetical protein AAY24_16750 [Sedimenticola thiotaurini]